MLLHVKSNESLTKYCSYATSNYKMLSAESTKIPQAKKLMFSAFLSGGFAFLYSPRNRHEVSAFWPRFSTTTKEVETEKIENLEVPKEENPVVKPKKKPPLKNVWKNSKITLYQYQNCPFCSKVRAFLLAYNIPFEMVEVHPLFKKEIAFSEYKKLPLLTIEQGETYQINDSSVIISVMSSYMIDNSRSLPDIIANFPLTTEIKKDGKEVKLIRNKNYLFINELLLTEEKEKALRKETKWRQWIDDYFLHLISPNLYRTLGESYKAFDYHTSLGPYHGTWEGFAAKYFGSVGMYAIGKLIKSKYGISKDVRVDLYAACNKVVTSIGKNKFLGGSEPNLADISLYGMMSVMEEQQVFKDLEQNTKIMTWYKRVKRSIKKHHVQDLRQNLKYETKPNEVQTAAASTTASAV